MNDHAHPIFWPILDNLFRPRSAKEYYASRDDDDDDWGRFHAEVEQ